MKSTKSKAHLWFLNIVLLLYRYKILYVATVHMFTVLMKIVEIGTYTYVFPGFLYIIIMIYEN